MIEQSTIINQQSKEIMEGFWGGLVIAIIDFFMVFLVLGGLAIVIAGLKKVASMLEEQKTSDIGQVEMLAPELVSALQPEDRTTDTHIAAILAAIQEFTSLPLERLKIDSIESVTTEELHSIQAGGQQKKALIAAISVAIHEFTSLPMSSFRITGIKPLGRMNPWKIAGRLELMQMDAD